MSLVRRYCVPIEDGLRDRIERSAASAGFTNSRAWTAQLLDDAVPHHPVEGSKEGPAGTGEYPARLKLVRVSGSVRSSTYQPDGSARLPLRDRGQSGWFVPAAAAQLHAMAIVAVARGWDLQITSGFRSWRSQERLYVGYQRWLDAGRPARDSVEWEQGMHDLAVGRPGFGTHQSGRAVDVRLSKWLGSGASMRDLWELMEAHGFRPFYTLDRPDADASEAWHFDFYGEWQRAFKQLGYRGGMLCCTADVGLLAPAYVSRRRNRAVQAQLTRAGADIGAIDGWIGARTRAGARDLGVDLSEPDDSLFESLFALPTVHA